jgi:hypothetical protein
VEKRTLQPDHARSAAGASLLWLAVVVSAAPTLAAKPSLVEKALQAIDGAEEIVFVERHLCQAYQYYATFGEYADEEKQIYAPDGSRLCKLNLRTRQVTVLLDDPGERRWQRVAAIDSRRLRRRRSDLPAPWPREPVIPPRIDLRKTTGQLVLSNVYHGRNVAGVRAGTIKKLLVLEDRVTLGR